MIQLKPVCFQVGLVPNQDHWQTAHNTASLISRDSNV